MESIYYIIDKFSHLMSTSNLLQPYVQLRWGSWCVGVDPMDEVIDSQLVTNQSRVAGDPFDFSMWS